MSSSSSSSLSSAAQGALTLPPSPHSINHLLGLADAGRWVEFTTVLAEVGKLSGTIRNAIFAGTTKSGQTLLTYALGAHTVPPVGVLEDIIGCLGERLAFSVTKQGSNKSNVFPLVVFAFNPFFTIEVANFLVAKHPLALVTCLGGDVVSETYPVGSIYHNCFTVAVALMTRGKASGGIPGAATTFFVDAERSYRSKNNMVANVLLETMFSDEEVTRMAAVRK